MRVEVDFLKVSGAGNDFLLIDNLQSAWSIDWPPFARAVCSRPFGVGADGILVLEPADTASFRMRYFNADGSYGGMCGNGGRCVARYAVERGISEANVRFEACGRLYQGDVEGEVVTLHLPDVLAHPKAEPFQTQGNEFLQGWLIDTGSPHVVFRIDDIHNIDVMRIGRTVRNHPLAGPSGTNVNFYQIEGDRLLLRTYERGVEAETLACGTGAVATALVSSVLDESTSPVRLQVRSGEDLYVEYIRTAAGFAGLTLKGSAHFLFPGTVLYDDKACRILSVPLHV